MARRTVKNGHLPRAEESVCVNLVDTMKEFRSALVRFRSESGSRVPANLVAKAILEDLDHLMAVLPVRDAYEKVVGLPSSSNPYRIGRSKG